MANCAVCFESTLGQLTDDVIQCNGSCMNCFHLSCVGLTRSIGKSVAGSPNIHWYCDACNIVSLHKVVENLTAAIVSLPEVISQSMLKLGLTPKQVPLSSSIQPEFTVSSKRKRFDDSYVAQTVPEQQQQSSQELRIIGSGETSSSIIAIEQRRSIVVSMLDTATTSDDLINFVNTSLELNDKSSLFRCNMLLPSGRNLEDLDFISYKLTASETLISSLLHASIWPKGVTVRDFIPKNRPPRRRPQGIPLFPLMTVPDQPQDEMINLASQEINQG